jgi:hypothetical protein
MYCITQKGTPSCSLTPKNGNDVRVMEARNRLRFVLKSSQAFGVYLNMVNHLQRDRSPQRLTDSALRSIGCKLAGDNSLTLTTQASILLDDLCIQAVGLTATHAPSPPPGSRVGRSNYEHDRRRVPRVWLVIFG